MEVFTDYYEEQIPFDCIYLDFAKAFDRVPHQRLLTKIHNVGIRGKMFNWIKNFLIEREQRVVINNKFSNWTNVISGIPQGSVLGRDGANPSGFKSKSILSPFKSADLKSDLKVLKSDRDLNPQVPFQIRLLH